MKGRRGKMGIVVLGSVFVDIKGYPLGAYIPGGRNAGRMEQVHGGVCRNVAEDIARVGLKPAFVSLVDAGGMGEDVIKKLWRSGVDIRYIRQTPDGMGTWLAIFDNSGDVMAAISKRPDLSPICEILREKGEEIFRNCDSICIELDMDAGVVEQTYAYAERYHKPVFAAVANMSIAMEYRAYLKKTACLVCNQQEAGILFGDNYDALTAPEMQQVLAHNIAAAQIPSMVVTMGEQGAAYAELGGDSGWCPAKQVDVQDTTGAGDSFFSGVAMGLTYGKTLAESCEIGSRLAASVIAITENVCPHFMPEEFGLKLPAAQPEG